MKNLMRYLLPLLFISHAALAEEPSLVDERVKDELATSEQPFVITPHKVNYILPVTYNSSPNMKPFEEEAAEHPFTLDEMEAKFQISFKFPLWYNVFGDNGHLFLPIPTSLTGRYTTKTFPRPFVKPTTNLSSLCCSITTGKCLA